MRCRLSLYAALAAVVAVMSPNLFATGVNATVGLCPGPGTHYLTIAAAITAVSSGSTIRVCPGNYPEQLLIQKSLTLEGITSGSGEAETDAVVIYPPSGGLPSNTSDAKGTVASQVLVQNTTQVTISNLTVDGKGNMNTVDDVRGITFQDASGTVNRVAVRNEVPNDTPTGVQSGQGIVVETTSSTSASLLVENSSVHNYNKNGIVARYAGTTLKAIGNYVQGNGPINYIAENGIEVAFGGATGTIQNNTVIDNVYTAAAGNPGNAATDILLYDSSEDGGNLVSGNTVGNAQDTIALVTDTPGTYGDGVTVMGNKVLGTSGFDAIDVCTNGNKITGNTIFNTAQSGVHLDASCGNTGSNNTISGNTIVESACAGYLFDTGTSQTGTPSGSFFTVPFPMTNSCTSTAGAAHAQVRNKFQP